MAKLIKSHNLEQEISNIRTKTVANTISKGNTIPSLQCIHYRGKNLSYLLQLWCQSVNLMLEPPDPTAHGWERISTNKQSTDYTYEQSTNDTDEQSTDDTDEHLSTELQMIADSAENLQKHREAYSAIVNQCSCKKSRCRETRGGETEGDGADT